jgi:hypothetical protein
MRGPDGTYPVPADYSAGADLDAQHVARVEQGEVPPDRVHPDTARIFWVANADVARYALGEPDPGPVPEYGCHVQDDVFTVGLEGWERRDAWGFGLACGGTGEREYGGLVTDHSRHWVRS